MTTLQKIDYRKNLSKKDYLFHLNRMKEFLDGLKQNGVPLENIEVHTDKENDDVYRDSKVLSHGECSLFMGRSFSLLFGKGFLEHDVDQDYFGFSFEYKPKDYVRKAILEIAYRWVYPLHRDYVSHRDYIGNCQLSPEGHLFIGAEGKELTPEKIAQNEFKPIQKLDKALKLEPRIFGKLESMVRNEIK